MEIIRNNKGGQKLCYLGHTYTKWSTSSSAIRWQCSRRRSLSCKGSVTTDLEVLNMISAVDHSHEPDPFYVEASRVRQIILANSAVTLKPGQLLDDYMSMMTVGGRQALGRRDTVKRSIQRKRQATRLLAPQPLQDESRTAQELQEPMKWGMKTSGNRERITFSRKPDESKIKEEHAGLEETEVSNMDTGHDLIIPTKNQVFIKEEPLDERDMNVGAPKTFHANHKEELFDPTVSGLESLITDCDKMVTPQEKAQCVLWLVEFKSATAVQQKYHQCYGKNAPSHHSIQSWYQKFLETGSVNDRLRSGYHKAAKKHSVNLKFT